MSHFTVLVPASDEKDLDARLLPYHEYECTGIEEYTRFVPEDMEELQAKYKEHGDGRTFDEFVPDWCGAKKNEEGIYGRVTNPNAEWDWWVVGGRWKGTLLLKAGLRKVDTALAGDIDWNAMQAQQVQEKHKRYQEWKALPDAEKDGVEARRRAILDGFGLIRSDEADDLDSMTEAEYVAKYGAAKAITFAYLDCEGKWHERADMGWFGMYGDKDTGYEAEWWNFVRSLPADQRVYVVDCHI